MREDDPRVHVSEINYDFGKMLNIEKGQHDFIIKNTGGRKLILQKGETTCKCTMSRVDKDGLEPGESCNVTLEWSGLSARGEFRQNATIYTNDPQRPKVYLTISGFVEPTLDVSPMEVVFSSVVCGDEATQEVRIRCADARPFKIKSYKFSDLEVAKHMDVHYEPLAKSELPGQAKSGSLLRVHLKPGLPLGGFNQTISLMTSLSSTEEVTIPIRGNVIGDIGVAGRGWNAENSTITLGAITSQEEFDRTYILIARGSSSDKVKFQIQEVEPPLLQVELGKPVKQGVTAMHTPLRIRIPRGTPPADYLSTDKTKTARIKLATHHPTIPPLEIHVRFAVRN